MLFKSIALGALMAGCAMAQSSSVASLTSSSSAAIPTVDPGSVDPQDKASWCIGQRNVCDTLCSKDAPTNICNANDLTFSCQCSDEKTPAGIDTYKTSLPAFTCNRAYAQCIKAHPDDASGQIACKDDILSQCGEKDIMDFVSSPSSGNNGDEEADATTTSTATSGKATRTATTTADESGATDAAASSAVATDAPAETTAAVGAAAKNGASLALAAGVMAAFVYML